MLQQVCGVIGGPKFRPIRRIGFVVLYFILSIIFYTHYEKWSPFSAIYFTIVTISTVGYGNQTPSDDISRLFTMFFIFVGIFVIFAGIGDLASNRLTSIQKHFCRQPKAHDSMQYETNHHKKTMILSLFYIFLCLTGGAIFFHYNEGWSWITSYYFAVETSTSVGYGDLYCNTSTRVFLCFYIVISIVLVAYAIGRFNSVLEDQKKLRERSDLLTQMQSLDFIAELNGGAGVRKHEFVLAVLGHLGVLHPEKDIAPWMKKFDDFDVDKSGVLSKEELADFFAQESEESASELRRIQRVKQSSAMVELLEESRQTIVETVIPQFVRGGRPRDSSVTEEQEVANPSSRFTLASIYRGSTYTHNHSNSPAGGHSNASHSKRGSGGNQVVNPIAKRSTLPAEQEQRDLEKGGSEEGVELASRN